MQRDPLPPGQHEIVEFPRFGLPQFADVVPEPDDPWRLTLSGDAQRSARIGPERLKELERVEQTSEFHCVTTWSRRGLRWGGVRFRDFYERVLAPAIGPEPAVRVVIFHCLDGFSVSLPLDDALQPDVLLADTLDGEPLSLAHGAPLRIVAPRHYGYKSAKHLQAIEVWRDYRHYRFPALRSIDHPRARVSHQERASGLVGWLFRGVGWSVRHVPGASRLHRSVLRRNMRRFEEGLQRHLKEQSARQQGHREGWEVS